MSIYIKQIEAAVQAIVFISPFTFSWFGKQPRLIPIEVLKTLSQSASRQYLLTILQEQLYSNFYCKGFASPIKWDANQFQGLGAATPFTEKLSQANLGNGYWSSGWLVQSLAEREIITVSQAGLTLRVFVKDCLSSGNNSIAVGDVVSLRCPREYPNTSPGFYIAASDKELVQGDWKNIIRIYWNITPAGAINLMRSVTSIFNRAFVPFRLKVLNDPAGFTRCDAVVLYLRRDDYHQMQKTIEAIYSELTGDLKIGTPVFTKPLTEEVGLAEEPLHGPSFGLHRCRVLADGLIRAHTEGKKTTEERVSVIADMFQAEGINLEKPFLNLGSDDIYSFTAGIHRLREYSRTKTSVISRDTLLGTAHNIGKYLVQKSIWSKDHCTWMGMSPKDLNNSIYSTLDSDLYSGVSGIGLFLAELYKATGDTQLKRTALGAVKQAFARADAIPLVLRLGLYTGWIGIALAGSRVGLLLQDEESLSLSKRLIHRTIREYKSKSQLDLMSGNAGAIIGLAGLQEIVEDSSLLNFSMRLGDELLETAVKFKDGYSWPTINAIDEYHLTGFSHGTAGMGYALLELFRETGDLRYCLAARKAFNYERFWFDHEMGNWPDLREASSLGRHRKHALAFSTYWCHGAPGIALSRLHAYYILGDEEYKLEALIALETTRNMVETSLYSRNMNFSLCHGLAGNAEILFLAHQVLGEEYSAGSDIAWKVAEAGMNLYGATGREWPCGTVSGTNPSLMLGLAGIGLFYLRNYDATIPSVLMIKRSIENKKKDL